MNLVKKLSSIFSGSTPSAHVRSKESGCSDVRTVWLKETRLRGQGLVGVCESRLKPLVVTGGQLGANQSYPQLHDPVFSLALALTSFLSLFWEEFLICPYKPWGGVLLLADAVLPRHFSLLILGGCDYGLGDLAWHGPRCRRWRRCRLADQGVLFRDAALSEVGFRGQRRRLMEVVERWVVGDVVWVEVMVELVVVVGVLWVWQHILLLHLLNSDGGRTRSLGLDLGPHLSRGDASRGRVAAAGRGLDSIQDFRFGDAVPDGLVRWVEVLLVGGPSLAAGDGLQGVCAAGGGVRGGGGATKVALTEGGDSGAGAAWQVGVTAIQDGLWTGGRGRYRMQGRLEREARESHTNNH